MPQIHGSTAGHFCGFHEFALTVTFYTRHGDPDGWLCGSVIPVLYCSVGNLAAGHKHAFRSDICDLGKGSPGTTASVLLGCHCRGFQAGGWGHLIAKQCLAVCKYLIDVKYLQQLRTRLAGDAGCWLEHLHTDSAMCPRLPRSMMARSPG